MPEWLAKFLQSLGTKIDLPKKLVSFGENGGIFPLFARNGGMKVDFRYLPVLS